MLDSIIYEIQKLGIEWQHELRIAAALIVMGLLLWIIFRLIFRRLCLWYWKADKQAASLENIDGKLDDIRNELKNRQVSEVAHTVPAETAEPVPHAEDSAETAGASGDSEDSGEDEGLRTADISLRPELKSEKTDSLSGIYNTGRSGRVYTEEELRALIKE